MVVIVRTHSGQIPPGLTGAETEDGYHERLAKTNFGRSGGNLSLQGAHLEVTALQARLSQISG